MMHGFQQIVAQAECRYNFVVHGLSPLGDEMAVSPLIWRKRLMDSISSNLGYVGERRVECADPVRHANDERMQADCHDTARLCALAVERVELAVDRAFEF